MVLLLFSKTEEKVVPDQTIHRVKLSFFKIVCKIFRLQKQTFIASNNKRKYKQGAVKSFAQMLSAKSIATWDLTNL